MVKLTSVVYAKKVKNQKLIIEENIYEAKFKHLIQSSTYNMSSLPPPPKKNCANQVYQIFCSAIFIICCISFNQAYFERRYW